MLRRHGNPQLTGLNLRLLGFSMALSLDLLITTVFMVHLVSPMANIWRFGVAYLFVLPLLAVITPFWGLVATFKGSISMLKTFSSLNSTLMLTNYPLTLISLWYLSDEALYSVYIYILMLNKITLSFFGSKVRQHLANPLFART